MEHRWGQRLNLGVAAQVLVGSRAPTLGRLQNVSVSGAFVRTRSPAPVGTLLELAVPFGSNTGAALQRATAYVARTTAEGIGIEWCDLAPPLALALLARPTAAARPPLVAGTGRFGLETAALGASRDLRTQRDRPSMVSAA